MALAGPPASGKSSLVKMIADAINAASPGRAAILGMDGFHYDDRVLHARGHGARKGAPYTFDVAGLRNILFRLHENADAEIAVPVFDRSLEVARANAAIIPKTADIVLVEGNYLLLKDAPWADLKRVFDVTVIIGAPLDELKRRLEKRWEHFGLAPDAASQKISENDLPNAELVIENSSPADYWIDTSAGEPSRQSISRPET